MNNQNEKDNNNKTATKTTERAYYIAHREEILAEAKRKRAEAKARGEKSYWQEHKAEMQANSRKHYETNRDATIERSKEYYYQHREKVLQQAKAWRAAHPEKVEEYKERMRQKRLAKKAEKLAMKQAENTNQK